MTVLPCVQANPSTKMVRGHGSKPIPAVKECVPSAWVGPDRRLCTIMITPATMMSPYPKAVNAGDPRPIIDGACSTIKRSTRKIPKPDSTCSNAAMRATRTPWPT